MIFFIPLVIGPPVGPQVRRAMTMPAQWFLKQGGAHPFKAIGIVATIIVFGSAILVKEG